MENKLFSSFQARVLKALANTSEIDESTLNYALNESEEICKNKKVPDFVRLDIAYIRLKIFLKIDLNGEDELLFKEALKIIDKAPLKSNEKGSKFYDVKNKGGEFC